MQSNQIGPPGLNDWEALYPALFQAHAAPVNLRNVLAEAPAEVLELVDLVEAHPLELTWDGRRVGLREIDKAKLADSMDVVRRCVEIVDGEQELLCLWLASLLR